MKSNTFFLGLSLLITPLFSHAQDDAQSKKILSELSKSTKAYSAISADFTSILENKAADLKVSQSGKLLLKGNKYSLDLEDFKVITDGTTTWTFAKEDQEVIVENTADLMETNDIDPSNIFSIWEEGFKHSYEGKKMVGQENCEVVKLYPIDPKERSFHTIVLFINTSKQEIRKVKVMGKSGEEYTYMVENFNGKSTINDSEFTFNPSKNPEFYVIDNR